MTIKALNIVYSYPVKWSLTKLLSDFIQNFFDAIGPENFSKNFKHTYLDNTLRLISHEAFSIEWLYFFGASTKRNQNISYAGKFGEGFKVASLIAHRDYNLEISMESLNWKLTVTKTAGKIENKDVMFLAYDITERSNTNETILTLKGIKENDYKDFIELLKDFYYKGNSILGECIFKNSKIGLYKSKEREQSFGRIYINYLSRKTIKIPLIICHNHFAISRDDRDRDTVYESEIKQIIVDVVESLPIKKCIVTLEYLEKYWSCNFSENKIGFAYKFLIEKLVHEISEDRNAVEYFKKKYKAKYIAKFYGYGQNDSLIVKAWYRHQNKSSSKKIIVPKSFYWLGIQRIYDVCLKHGGLNTTRKPSNEEYKYLSILTEIVNKFFNELVSYSNLPDCEIITNNESPVHGLAHCQEIKGKTNKKYNLKVVSNIYTIKLKFNLFSNTTFAQALTTYLHELLHQYGGDASKQFNKALFFMNSIILSNLSNFEEYETRWKTITNQQKPIAI